MDKQYNCIDGKFVPASAEEWIDNINPATQEVMSQIPRSRELDVDRAVGAKGQEQPWARYFRGTCHLLEKIAVALKLKWTD